MPRWRRYLTVAIALAAFSILFGTRHIDATEHQDGLMLAIAAESLLKLATFVAVGAFVLFGMLGGIGGLMGMMPGIAKLKNQMAERNLDDSLLKRQMAIIDSMTPGAGTASSTPTSTNSCTGRPA